MERQHITQIKSISIESYLESQGMKPAKAHGQKLYYHSPFRTDSTPSFVVNLDSNTYKDFAEDEKPEDIIRLVQRLHKFSFKEACQHLNNWTNTAPSSTPFLSNGQSLNPTSKSHIIVLNTRALEAPYLIDYLTSRKIDITLGYLYLTEVMYLCKGKRYKGIGFKNNEGGYEIKNAHGLTFTARPKAATYFPVSGSKVISVFEGFFDFLSALMYYRIPRSNHSVLVLNSVTNVTKSVPILSKYQTLNAYLDNDEAGKKAYINLRNHRLNVVDCSHVYEGFKDFNEFWMHKGNL